MRVCASTLNTWFFFNYNYVKRLVFNFRWFDVFAVISLNAHASILCCCSMQTRIKQSHGLYNWCVEEWKNTMNVEETRGKKKFTEILWHTCKEALYICVHMYDLKNNDAQTYAVNYNGSGCTCQNYKSANNLFMHFINYVFLRR